MYHFTYKVETASGKFYVGRHSTTDLDDGYVGSGKWVRSLKDKSVLQRTILEFFEDETALQEAEERLISSVIDDPLNMNFNERPVGFSSVNNPNKSTEARIRLSERVMGANNPMFGKTQSEEYKAKLREQMAGEGNPMFGKKHDEETRARMKASRVGMKFSDEGRAKLSASRKQQYEAGKRKVPSWAGMTHSDETKQKMREKALAKPKKQCPHCDRLFAPQTYGQWHGDKCKMKTLPALNT